MAGDAPACVRGLGGSEHARMARCLAVSWTGIQLLDSFLMADSANSLVFGLAEIEHVPSAAACSSCSFCAPSLALLHC